MNLLGFDDAPFERHQRGKVPLVGVICAGTRVDGVLVGKVRHDGADSTRRMVELVAKSQFARHIQAVLLQGIAVAGFNVVDVHALHAALGVPVLVIARRRPRFERIRRAVHKVPGGARKWRLIERAGEPEPIEGVMVPRIGIDRDGARRIVRASRLHGSLPEPLRVAHLIAGALVLGVSHGAA